MAPLAEAFVRVSADTKPAQGDVRGFFSKMGHTSATEGRRSGHLFARSYLGPLKAIGIAAGGLFALSKAKDFLTGSVAEAREAQKVTALTAQVIKTTGGAARVTADDVNRLATAISNKTGIDDEMVQAGSNVILTFKNIRNEVGAGNAIFDRATQATTDMSAALDKGLKSTAIQVGKALNDPIKGLTALGRAGVQFTAKQTDRIKKFVEEGKVIRAQKVELRELHSEFGGAAAASSTAGEKLRVVWDNMKEQLGTALLPLLDKLEGFLAQKIIPGLTTLAQNVMPPLSHGFSVTRDAIAGFFGAFTGEGSDSLDRFSGPTANKLIDAGVGARKVFDGIVTVVRDGFIPYMKQVWKIIETQVLPTLTTLVRGVLKQAQSSFKTVASAVRENAPQLKEVAKAIGALIVIAVKLIGPVLKYGLIWQLKIMGKLITTEVTIIGLLVRAFHGLIDAAKAVGRGVVDAFHAVVDFFKDLPGRIKDVYVNAGRLLYNVGKAIVEGLKDGIVDAAKSLPGLLKDKLVDGPIDKVKGFLHIGSPSKLFADEVGRPIADGVAKGIADGAPGVLRAAKNLVDDLHEQVSAAASARGQVRSDFQSLASGIFGALAPTADAFGTTNPVGIANVLSSRKHQLIRFRHLLGVLDDRHVAQRLINDFAGQGLAALPTVAGLAGARRSTLHDINRDFRQSVDIARRTARGRAQASFGDELRAANHRLDRLHDALSHANERLHAIEQATKNVGHDTANELDGVARGAKHRSRP